jgi:hypothetical protein
LRECVSLFKQAGYPVSKNESRGELNLTPSAHGGEYSADVLGEIIRYIF